MTDCTQSRGSLISVAFGMTVRRWFLPRLSQEMKPWVTVCKALIDELAAYDTVILDDNSPMFILRIAYTAANDSIKTGQIAVTASYGTLRKYQQVPKLNVADITTKLKG